jgi:hypothetical protein
MNKRRWTRLKDPAAVAASKAGWRVGEWSDAVGLCRATVYKLLATEAIASVKSGSARIILTSPSDYLAGLAVEPVKYVHQSLNDMPQTGPTTRRSRRVADSSAS